MIINKGPGISVYLKARIWNYYVFPTFQYSIIPLFQIVLFTFIILSPSQKVSAQSALEFDGVDDMVIIYDSTSIIPLNDFTIEAWFNPQDLIAGQNRGVIFSKYDSSWNKRCIVISSSASFIECILYCDVNDSVVVSCDNLDTLAWKHFALCFSITNMLKLYINGEIVDSAQASSSMTLSQVPLRLGNMNFSNISNNNHYHGKLDELRIWNFEVSKSDIKQNIYTCLSGSESGLIALYSMDSGFGNILFDKTGSGFDGIILDASWIYSDRSCTFVRSNSPICQGNPLLLIADSISGATFLWSGPNGFSSNIQSPVLYNTTPSISGMYYVIVDTSGGSFTDSTYVLVNDMNVFIGNDTVICPGDNFILDAGPGYFYYEWSTGSTNQSIVVTQAGNYSVQVHKYTSNCYPCKAIDHINISFPSPPVQLGNDSVLCKGDTLLLDAGSGYSSYLWQDGSTGQYFYAADSATYWVEVSDTSGCILYDSIYFDDEYYPLISLPDDTILCPGESLFLTAGDSVYNYLWSNGQTNSSIIAEKQYYYHVTVANISCISKDSIVLDYHSLGNETDYWYFGGNSGIYFSGGSVSALNDGVMNQTEGCASISDANGNLLFYTDGISVWNRLHNQMPNGTGLNGSSDATNSALIVKKPGSINVYYIFTLDNAFGSNGLCYSVVDMDDDISYGDVVQKNISLLTTASEKMTAVKHYNNQDVWLITHTMNTNTFYSYLVTSSGINNTAVMSNSGSVYNNWQYSVGCMKVSPDGHKLAVAYHFQAAGFCELFDFDNFTGIVSNSLVLDDYKWPYGVEFSPDNTKLYISERMLSRIRQIDLMAGSPTDIVNSSVVISKTISSPPFALQIGIDGKIYVAKMTSPYLGVINSPDNIGMSCNYLDDGVFLGGSISKLGLPSFVQSYYNLPNFTHSNFCLGDYTYFSIQDSVDIDSVLWNFGDPIAGILNYSNIFNPVHYYDTAGVYDVKLKIYSKCKVDSINKPIIIYAVPQVYLGNDTLIHTGDSVVLYAGGFQNASYYWLPNGETTQSITAISPAHYILVVTDTISGCSGSDTIKVYVQNDNCLFDVDFNTWLQQGDTANGKWNVSPLGDFVYQTVNSDLTYFVSPDDFINVKISGNMRVYSNWDDDYVGFVFGYKSPNDSTVHHDYEFLLFDWKQSTQVIASTPPITAYEGFSLVEVNGLISNYEISDFFWSHSDDPRFQIIDTLYGSPYGWNDYQTYHFDLTYTTSYVVIVIDNDTIFNVKGCFQPGRFGLYNYSQAYVEFSDFSYQLYTDFEFTDVCFGEENHFSSLDSNCLPVPGQLIFWDWDFGDGSYSDKVNPSYTYQNHGIFPVTLKITDHLGCTDSVTKEINVFPLPDTQLANDTNLCTGSSVLLDPGSGYISYLWQDGSTNQTFITDTAGVFFLDVIDNNNCLGPDTIVVDLVPLPEPDLGNDTLICYGDTILLDPGMGYSSYLWQDGNTAQIFPASNSDIYWVQVIDSNLCSAIDSITITTEYCSVVTVLLDSFRVCPDTLIINVIIRNMTNTGAISLIMFYDNSILNYIGYQNLHPTLISGSYALNGGGGTFGMSWYSMMPVDIYDDTLFELVFYFNGGSSDLSWDTLTTGNCEFGDIGGNIIPAIFIDGFVEQTGPNPLIINQPYDVSVCELNDATFIISTTGDTSFQWQIYSGIDWMNIMDTAAYFGSRSDTLIISDVTLMMDNNAYRCVVSGICDPKMISDSVILTVNPIPLIDVGNDTLICHGDTTIFDAGPGFISYLWNDSSTNQSIVTSTAGTYWVIVTDNNSCFGYDTVNLALYPVPQASTGADTSMCYGDSISLTAIGGITYLWNTGSLSNSIIVGPAVTSTYTVTVSDINSCTASDDVIVSIKPLPVISIGNDTSICIGDTIIIDADTGFVSYLWQDGSTGQSISAYQSGLYTLEVENIDGCRNRDSLQLSLLPLPIVNLGSDTSICSGDTATFDAGSGFMSYLWNNSSTNQSILCNIAGTYWIMVSDNYSCVGYDTINLALYPLPQANAGNDTSICLGDSLQLTAFDLPGYSFIWSTGQITPSIIVQPTSATSYYLTVSENTCLATDSIEVTVNPVPVIFIGNDTTICEGNSVIFDPGSGYSEYSWMDGSSAQQMIASNSGVYWVRVINIFGCTDSDTAVLYTYPVPVLSVIPDDPAICEGNSVILSVSGALEYSWTPSSTLSSDTGSVVEAFPLVSTTYVVLGTDHIGCTAQLQVFVEIFNNPNILIIPGDTVVCEGDSITLTASGAIIYTWSPLIGLSGITGEQVEANPPYSIRYLVTGTDIHSCVDTASIFLVVNPVPYVNLGEDFYLCDGVTRALRVSPDPKSNIYSWQDGSDAEFYIVAEPGMYWVIVSNDGCKSIDTVNALACTDIWIPNAFSPDNDGLNDVFKPKSSTNLIDYQMQIYNRWGALIYESSDINDGWDGTFKGKICQCGVYTYKIRYKGYGIKFLNEGKTLIGYITLIR